MLSVELVPDPQIEAVVRDDWARLEAAGLANSGRNPSPSNRPHITVAVRDDLEISSLDGVAAQLPIPLELGGIVLFRHRDRVVVARQVVASAALLRLHLDIADRTGPAGPRYTNTAPDRWTPHVTLARAVPVDRVSEVLRAIAAPPVLGEAVGLRVWNASTKVVTTLV